jgi:hypothetical protein
MVECGGECVCRSVCQRDVSVRCTTERRWGLVTNLVAMCAVVLVKYVARGPDARQPSMCTQKQALPHSRGLAPTPRRTIPSLEAARSTRHCPCRERSCQRHRCLRGRGQYQLACHHMRMRGAHRKQPTIVAVESSRQHSTMTIVNTIVDTTCPTIATSTLARSFGGPTHR